MQTIKQKPIEKMREPMQSIMVLYIQVLMKKIITTEHSRGIEEGANNLMPVNGITVLRIQNAYSVDYSYG